MSFQLPLSGSRECYANYPFWCVVLSTPSLGITAFAINRGYFPAANYDLSTPSLGITCNLACVWCDTKYTSFNSLSRDHPTSQPAMK